MPSIRVNGINYSLGGSGNTNYVELTLAEYEALGDSVNSDGILYFIKDVESGQNNVLEWKKHMTVTGATSIPYPSEYNELMVVTTVGSGGYCFSKIFAYELFYDHNITYFQDGFAMDYRVAWIPTTTSIALSVVHVGSVTDISSAITTLYYR